MWTRILLIGAILIGGGWVASPPVQAGCLVDSGTYTTGTVLREPLCDTSGNLKTTLGGSSSGGLGTANAAAPTLVEAASATFSFDLSGNVRMTMGTLLSGEDQTNNLIMTSGGAVRTTIVAAAVTGNATSTATTIPVGSKSVEGLLVCNAGGSTNCGITYEIRGSAVNNPSSTTGVSLCTAVIPTGSANQSVACPVMTANYSYFWVVTTGVAGTSPVLNVYAMY
jgi:hypothetical protein